MAKVHRLSASAQFIQYRSAGNLVKILWSLLLPLEMSLNLEFEEWKVLCCDAWFLPYWASWHWQRSLWTIQAELLWGFFLAP